MDIIIGSDGFLGSNFRQYHTSRAWPFFAIGRADADLRDLEQCRNVFSAAPKAKRLFHCVTFQRTGSVQYERQAELLMNNLRIHSNILECWREFQPQAKLISMGSSCTYPESGTPLPESLFGAGPVHGSVKGYAFAKQLIALGSELYAKQYGMSYLHCVLATLYGPYDHTQPDRSHFIGAMLHRAVLEKAAGEKQLTLWGRPDVIRECLYVEDQIEAILAADQHFSNRILNCGPNTLVSVDEVAETIKQVIGWNVPSHYVAGSFVGTLRKSLDSSEFLQATGWTPRYTLKAGLETLYQLEYHEKKRAHAS